MKLTGSLQGDQGGDGTVHATNTRQPSRRRSFTLLELMIAIAIIGILAMMLVPALQTAREKARATNCMANLRAISTALTLYADDQYGKMPPALDLLVNGIYLPNNSAALIEPKASIPYLYHQPPTIWQSSGASVSVEDPSDLHLGGRNQLLNDGTVRKVSP
jgi:prepilin-type N-terminal cleavage/methylation domain-containing protein